jgi:hypothetical protein
MRSRKYEIKRAKRKRALAVVKEEAEKSGMVQKGRRRWELEKKKTSKRESTGKKRRRKSGDS